jgi:hypothetical protein
MLSIPDIKDYLKLCAVVLLMMGCNSSVSDHTEQVADSTSVKKDSVISSPKYNSTVLYKDTFLLGHFDLQKGIDTAWLMVPMKEFEMFGCYPCSTRVVFTNQSDSIYFTEGDIGGRIANVGDLNADGVDELLYCDAHFNGCWSTLRLYSFKRDLWHECGGIEFYACVDRIDFIKRVKKINKNRFVLIGDDVDGAETAKEFKFPD